MTNELNSGFPTSSGMFGLPPEALEQVFPFHIVLNRDLHWVQIGSALQRLLATMPVRSTFLLDHFQINVAKGIPTFEILKNQTNSLILLHSLDNDEVQLKGQMVYVEASNVLIFLGSPWITEISHLQRLGLSLQDFPPHDSLGEYLFLLQGMNSTLIDTQKLTAQLKTQTAQLKSTTSRLRTLIECLQAGVLLEDECGQIVLVNQVFLNMFGISTPPEALQGLDCQQAAQGSAPYFEAPDLFLMRVQEILQRQAIVVNEEIRLKDGRTFERDYIPIVSSDVYRGHLWLYRDISDRKHMQFQLEKAKEFAESANLAKGQFLANMSHELRTPLNSIIGFAQLMNRNPDLKPQERESIEIINRSGEHLLSLINNILEMAKIESGQVLCSEDSFDLRRQLKTIEAMLSLKVQAKGLQLRFQGVQNVSPYIRTDEGKLRQVLINLLDNAIKFTDRGAVTLRVSEEHDSQSLCLYNRENLGQQAYKLFFEIADTGSGMTDHEMKQLFQPFVQTISGQRSRQGTGLGLSICRKFVQLLGGDITVYSTLGEGTCFTFSIQVLPALPLDVTADQNSKRVVGLAANQETFRLLVVDDIPENRQLLVKLLVPLGFEVREAENGQAAIALWADWSPHLIWLDMEMPVMNGYEAAHYIKRQCNAQNTVLIAVTASALAEERQAILDAGCDDWVYKPLQENILFDKLSQHLKVHFTYDQHTEIEEACASDAPVELTREMIMAIMPPDWLQLLNRAARSGDDEQILELIRSIPVEYSTLITELTTLANEFAFDRLKTLTEL